MSKKWTPKKLKKNNVGKVGSYNLIYLHMLQHTTIYLQIALYTFINPHIHQNIESWKMRANIKHKNGHNSAPRASPMGRIWHVPSYRIPGVFPYPKVPQIN